MDTLKQAREGSVIEDHFANNQSEVRLNVKRTIKTSEPLVFFFFDRNLLPNGANSIARYEPPSLYTAIQMLSGKPRLVSAMGRV